MNLTLKNILLLTAPLLLTACVTTPKPDAMKKDVRNFKLPKLPQNGKAMVYVVRPARLGTMIKFNVFVDNKKPESERGYTNGEQYIYFDINRGKHTIFSKAKNWASIDLSCNAGDIFFIEQKPNSSFPLPTNTLLRLPEYEGKYYVKHLKLGTIK